MKARLTINYDPDGADTEIFNSSTDTLNRLTLDIANGLDGPINRCSRFRADFAQQGIDVTAGSRDLDRLRPVRLHHPRRHPAPARRQTPAFSRLPGPGKARS